VGAELALKALGYAVIGLLLVTMLVLIFASMHKEERRGASIRGFFWLPRWRFNRFDAAG
jgi:hypothetical protein